MHAAVRKLDPHSASACESAHSSPQAAVVGCEDEEANAGETPLSSHRAGTATAPIHPDPGEKETSLLRDIWSFDSTGIDVGQKLSIENILMS